MEKNFDNLTRHFSYKDLEKKHYFFDGGECSWGRLASVVALVLSGKLSTQFSAHSFPKFVVTVYNAENLYLTGKKQARKRWYQHSGYPGGLREIILSDENKARVFRKSVLGMMRRNRRREFLDKNLFVVYGRLDQPTGVEHLVKGVRCSVV